MKKIKEKIFYKESRENSIFGKDFFNLNFIYCNVEENKKSKNNLITQAYAQFYVSNLKQINVKC
jgi:hypothetical protein